VFDDLLWSNNGFDIFVQCVDNMSLLLSLLLLSLLFQLHPKANSNLFGHFFNPYISLILEDLNIVHNCIFNSIAIPKL